MVGDEKRKDSQASRPIAINKPNQETENIQKHKNENPTLKNIFRKSYRLELGWAGRSGRKNVHIHIYIYIYLYTHTLFFPVFFLVLCLPIWVPISQLPLAATAAMASGWALPLPPSAAAGPSSGQTGIQQRSLPAAVPVGPALCRQLPAAQPLPTYHSTVAPKLTSRRGGELAKRAGRVDGRGRVGVAARHHSSARPPQHPGPPGAVGHSRACGMFASLCHAQGRPIGLSRARLWLA